MAGYNISQLPWPEPGFRPHKDTDRPNGKPKFESLESAYSEDAKRARLLRSSARLAARPDNQALAEELANRLDYSRRDVESPQTLACSAYMRDQRIRIGGALWKFATATEHGAAATLTVIGRGLEIPHRQLSSVDPRAVCAAFRSDLNRCGAKDASGYIVAFLDGEYESSSDMFRLHFHGLVAGNKRHALERLRTTPKYASSRIPSAGERMVQRVRVSRGLLTNMPDPLTYLLKSFWPCRWEGSINGIQRRQSFRSRIPEPRHSQLLLWLDRWSLKDFTLLMGLRVASHGFVTTNNTYTDGEGK